MSELQAFVALGFRHITDSAAMDHILFLLALAAIYRLRDWRDSLWVVSAFTVGHSLTLALAVTGALTLPTRLIEFLIPLTIVATCVENLVVRDRQRALWRGRYRPVFTCATCSWRRSPCRCSGSTWGSSWVSWWCSRSPLWRSVCSTAGSRRSPARPR